MVWRKSSFSGGGSASGANCVEVAIPRSGRLSIRDSKHPAVVLDANLQLLTWLKTR